MKCHAVAAVVLAAQQASTDLSLDCNIANAIAATTCGQPRRQEEQCSHVDTATPPKTALDTMEVNLLEATSL